MKKQKNIDLQGYPKGVMGTQTTDKMVSTSFPSFEMAGGADSSLSLGVVSFQGDMDASGTRTGKLFYSCHQQSMYSIILYITGAYRATPANGTLGTCRVTLKAKNITASHSGYDAYVYFLHAIHQSVA